MSYFIKIKNWQEFQSYKDRNPPWIRFHKKILDNFEFQKMSANARALLPMLWLMASEDKDPVSGCIQGCYESVTFRLRGQYTEVTDGVNEIFRAGFIELNVPELEEKKQQVTQSSRNGHSETETETETNRVRKEEFAQHRERFERFWKLLPPEMKKGKEKAWSFFKNQVKTDQDFADIQKALKNYVADVEKIRANNQPELQFQNGSTWFNHRWKDYVDMPTAETWAEKRERLKKEKND